MSLLEIANVTLVRDGVAALDDVGLTVAKGEIVALAGPSGSGKTSLLRVVLGLVAPTRGIVRLRDRVVSRDAVVVDPPEARALAIVFQDLGLWPHLSVHGNLAFGLDARGVPRAERDRRIDEMLSRVSLEGFGGRSPSTLSGGERQRVAIARALVGDPDLFLFDEALANLDVALKADVLALLGRLLAERKIAALYVTHDPREARGLAHRIAVLERGRVVQVGTLAELAADPQTTFVRAFTS